MMIVSLLLMIGCVTTGKPYPVDTVHLVNDFEEDKFRKKLNKRTINNKKIANEKKSKKEKERRDYYNCIDTSIKIYTETSINLNLIKKAVWADCYDFRFPLILPFTTIQNFNLINKLLFENLEGSIARALILKK